MGVPDDIEAFAAAVGPRPDDVLAEMDRRAESEGFPTVGAATGGWLRQLAGLIGAQRVFEFGSGFGYSAYWLCGGLAEGGEIVLTEIDAAELEAARTYLERGGYAERARFEHGDAVGIVERYDGPFDLALIDNEKRRYVEAFEAIRSKIPVGGVVVADNTIEGPFEFGTLRDLVENGTDSGDEPTDSYADAAAGVARYLEHVRDTPEFETTLLPLGEGLAVSRRIE